MVIQSMKNAADDVTGRREISKETMESALKYTTYYNSFKELMVESTEASVANKESAVSVTV